jgi:heme-degrading monooxygenase HmoA
MRRTAFRKQLARQRVKYREAPLAVDGPIARVANVAVRPEHRDALVADYNDRVRNAYEQQPGFAGAVLLLDGEDPGLQACSITLWEAARDLDAAVETASYAEAMQQLATHFNGYPETKTWEIAAAFIRPDNALRPAPKPKTNIRTDVVEVESER